MTRHVMSKATGKPGGYTKVRVELDPEKYPFLLTIQEIRRRVPLLLKQGWTYTALATAFGWHKPGARAWVASKCVRANRAITNFEQIRISRVLYLIESGWMKPDRDKSVRRGAGQKPILCDPPPPVPVPTIVMTPNGVGLAMRARPVYPMHVLFGRKNP